MTDRTDGAALEGIINVIFLELPKLPPLDANADIESLPSAVKWGPFIKEADNFKKPDLIDRLTKSEEGIMSADAMLKSLSDEGWRWIEQGRIEGDERDRISGLYNAEQRGIRSGKQESARNMLADRLPVEEIAQYTGLSVEDIQALAAQPVAR